MSFGKRASVFWGVLILALATQPAFAALDDKNLKSVSLDELLVEARARYDSLDYDRVIPLVDEVLVRAEVTLEQKLAAYLLRASSLAIMGDPIEAEKPFRLLLRSRPDFELPPDTPPKILAAFRKVQVEERAIADQLRALERQRISENLELIGEHPKGAQGGEAIEFAYRLRDPASVVEVLRIHYRKRSAKTFSALALSRDQEGVWRGDIPGEWTANEGGFVLDFFLEAGDKQGALLSKGSIEQPLYVEVAPGQVKLPSDFVLPKWSFWTSAGTTLALVLGAAGTGLATQMVQNDYTDLIRQGANPAAAPISGAELNGTADTGTRLATMTNALWISAAVTAVATGVIAVLVDWDE